LKVHSIKIRFFIYSVLVLAPVELVGGFLISRNGQHVMSLLGVMRGIEVVILLLIFRYNVGGLTSIGLGQGDLLSGVKRGIVWSIGFGVLVCVSIGILVFLGYNPLDMLRMEPPDGPFEIIVYFCVAGLIAPIAEEVIFRGILYGFLRQWSLLAAFVISNSVFLALHPEAGFVQCTGALLFTLSYELEGKLLVPITIHILGNSALICLSNMATIL
jgi:membrane protease YdiL (CAAX protease family)